MEFILISYIFGWKTTRKLNIFSNYSLYLLVDTPHGSWRNKNVIHHKIYENISVFARLPLKPN